MVKYAVDPRGHGLSEVVRENQVDLRLSYVLLVDTLGYL
jgi:hypothetical protein